MCVSVSLCVCVSLMGRRWLFGGKPQLDCVAVCFCCTWQQVSPVWRCLRLAACASRSTAFALCCCSESSLWLRVKVSEHSHQLLRMCGSDAVASSRRGKAQFQAVAVALYCRLVCVCVWVQVLCVLCVRTACEVGILAGPVATKRGWVAAEDSSHDSSTNGKFSSFSLPTYVHTCMYCVYMYIGMCVCILRYFKIEEGLTISSTYIHTLSYETFMLMCSNFKGT